MQGYLCGVLVSGVVRLAETTAVWELGAYTGAAMRDIQGCVHRCGDA